MNKKSESNVRYLWLIYYDSFFISDPISELQIKLGDKVFSEGTIAVDAGLVYPISAVANGVNANGASIATVSYFL